MSTPTILQKTLSLAIKHPKKFIEEIENLNNVYSIRDLNLIANDLNIRLSDLFPIDNLSDDLLELEV